MSFVQVLIIATRRRRFVKLTFQIRDELSEYDACSLAGPLISYEEDKNQQFRLLLAETRLLLTRSTINDGRRRIANYLVLGLGH